MAFCCQLLLLPHTAASHYSCRHCCHCLSRGSSGKAGVAACGGGSGNSSSVGSGGGSGAILFLIVVVILLLFACPLLVGIVLPLFVARCSFRRPPLANLSTHNGWLLFAPKSKLKSKLLRWRGCAAPSIFAPRGFSLLDVHSVFYSGSCRASFSGIHGIPWNPQNSVEQTSEINHSRARLMCSGIRRKPELGRNSGGWDP